MKYRIVKIAAFITSITLASKFIGFLRDVIFAGCFGTTYVSDAFLMVQSIISIVSAVLMAALATAFIPVMSDYALNRQRSETEGFLSAIYSLLLMLAIGLSVMVLVFAKQVIFLFAPSFNADTAGLSSQLLAILAPSIVAVVLVTLNNGVLQCSDRYLVASAIGFPMNLAMITVMLFVSGDNPILLLAYGVLAGSVLQVLIQMPGMCAAGYRIRLSLNLTKHLKDTGVRRIGVLILPVVAGVCVQQIDTIVDRILASGLQEGSISAINFSNRLSMFAISLLGASVASICYTKMAQLYSVNRVEEMKQLIRNTTNVISALVVPASVGLLVLREPIVRFVFERGRFDADASALTATALFFFSFGLLGYALRDLYSRAFYSIQDSRTPMTNGIVCVVLNVFFNLVLVGPLKLGGLALATSISGSLGTVLLMAQLKKKIGCYGIHNIAETLLRVAMASLCMYAVLYLLSWWGREKGMYWLAVEIIAGSAVYLGMGYVLNVEPIRLFVGIALEKVRSLRAGASGHP